MGGRFLIPLSAENRTAAGANLERMPYTHRKEWVRWVTDAKKSDTRAARIAKTVQSLHDDKRTR
jgi:uncharacterized protein YdeI (YjbR/CyaY-like superfamily)